MSLMSTLSYNYVVAEVVDVVYGVVVVLLCDIMDDV